MTIDPSDSNLLYPLNGFYEKSGIPLPDVSQVDGSEIPQPYRTILVHERDMTPTLEETYGCGIELRVLDRKLRGDVYSREIVLVLEGTAKAVVFGAIDIYLERFPAGAKALVLEGKQPLGSILRAQGIVHSSRPSAYFRVAADAVINRALHLTGAGFLYGRRNVLLDSEQRILARIIEILPPS